MMSVMLVHRLLNDMLTMPECIKRLCQENMSFFYTAIFMYCYFGAKFEE